MTIANLREGLRDDNAGPEMHRFIAELYPICRSITGDGFRETLRHIQERIPLSVHEVVSGTPVFDWVVPREWNIRDAYVKNAQGERVVDFRQSNLHVVNYSVPVHTTLTLDELKEHLHTLPEHPDWIPYRTSYYKEAWGFCLSHAQFLTMEDGEYEVCIESTLRDGHLTYGECYLKGRSEDEVLISCHACHPSLCNDNLSGVAVATFLAGYLSQVTLRYSYRFLFIPGTIGSITWLSLHEQDVDRIKHGLVVTCVGDAGHPTYKRSRRGDAEIDRAVAHVLAHRDGPHAIEDFVPYGYDERQYCSPGFNLPLGCLMRTPNGRFPEYHTSADNLELVRPESLEDSLSLSLSILAVLEHNRTYLNQNPKCEPQLGRRGLYSLMGGHRQGAVDQMALLWVLNLSDGRHSLLDIAERSGMSFDAIDAAARVLVVHGLLSEMQP